LLLPALIPRAAPPVRAAGQPNIILIVTDDQDAASLREMPACVGC
jgi:hypothetical protein